jgi:peptidase M19 renal dipeptidase
MYNIIDAHCDTAYELYKILGDLNANQLSFSIDKIKKYHSYIQFFAVWSDPVYIGEQSLHMAKKIIEYLKYQLTLYQVPIILNRCDLEKYRDTKGLKCFLTVEGGEPVGEDICNLDLLYEMGVRLMTLTWNGINAIGCGSTSGWEKGLTDFGKQVVRRMNQLGMTVDVSHLNEAGFYDVMEITQKPVMASHSNSKFLHPHKRNLSDEQFLELVENNGVTGINIYPLFLGKEENLSVMVRHIEHFLSLGGEDHIGIGTDFDGIDRTIPEIQDVSQMENLINRLLQLNYSETVIKKISFENVYRVIYENLNNE